MAMSEDVRLDRKELHEGWDEVEADRPERCELIAAAQQALDQAHEEDWPSARLRVELALLVYETARGRERLELSQIVRSGGVEFTVFRDDEA